jgi:hypothetical protein
MNLNSTAEGSSHPLLTKHPPKFTPCFCNGLLAEQRAIAGVLSSLDDKIDLLHRQNKTLEGKPPLSGGKCSSKSRPGMEEGNVGRYS